MPRTFLATLHFDGTGFVGWQRQREGRTVQSEVETVLERLAGQAVRVHAAGRTDAGVHALGMGVSFTLPDRWTPIALHRALNGLLPGDCYVAAVREAHSGFHARRCATERQYRYLIGTDPDCRSPFRRRFEWALGTPLSIDRLGPLAERIVGEHDFKALSVRASRRPHTRCEVRSAQWTERAHGQGVSFEIRANRFLHHMVRMVVGTMVEIALGRRHGADVERLLAQDPAVVTSPPAPAQGLYFMTAVYDDQWFA
ncbi:MAG: tRNA pseudouridine(38-40) synthase TruA [Gemmatimonadetes bacterium]|nr:tRNA pseudouridine(38-40) synthase TruA [Gemmatimonadota bacterium]